jgi:hypothetical protein
MKRTTAKAVLTISTLGTLGLGLWCALPAGSAPVAPAAVAATDAPALKQRAVAATTLPRLQVALEGPAIQPPTSANQPAGLAVEVETGPADAATQTRAESLLALARTLPGLVGVNLPAPTCGRGGCRFELPAALAPTVLAFAEAHRQDLGLVAAPPADPHAPFYVYLLPANAPAAAPL